MQTSNMFFFFLGGGQGEVKVVAVCDFRAEYEGELSFLENDVFTVFAALQEGKLLAGLVSSFFSFSVAQTCIQMKRFSDEACWWGTLRGSSGVFPSECVQVLKGDPSTLPLKSIEEELGSKEEAEDMGAQAIVLPHKTCLFLMISKLISGCPQEEEESVEEKVSSEQDSQNTPNVVVESLESEATQLKPGKTVNAKQPWGQPNIANNLGAFMEVRVQASCDFRGEDDMDLTFKKGDTLVVEAILDEDDACWWGRHLRQDRNELGIFPCDLVELLQGIITSLWLVFFPNLY